MDIEYALAHMSLVVVLHTELGSFAWRCLLTSNVKCIHWYYVYIYNPHALHSLERNRHLQRVPRFHYL
jgi:hypothetical protein